MDKVVMPKKMAINFSFMALLSMIASGRLNAATAIVGKTRSWLPH